MSTNNVNIVNTNNWYQQMNIIGNQNVTNMVISSTNPSAQMLLISSANDVHYCYSNYPLSKTNGFTLTFQLYITGTNMNSICAYFGVTDSTTSFDANGGLPNQTGAIALRIAPATPIFQLYNNYGTNTIVATSSTSVASGAWQTVTVTYTPSVSNTWVVNYNGTNVISYNDSSYTTFANNQNTVWGIYGTTSNTVSASIRAVDLSVKQSLSLSELKNTYNFYPEESFINKLSTHSQNNLGAAFGLRLLNASYLGPIINVRRGSDNATLDFFADSKGNIGRTLYGNGQTLLSWLAGSIGYVTRWYDQSNNGRDVINTTTSQQPKIGTPILDTISSAGKSAARGVYTLYRANSTYTGATIKLRRSSDNIVSDFYADIYGNLSDASGTSFTSWIGSSTAYVDTWYDQSGNNFHATQTTTANQPVYNGTLKLIDSLNSSSLFLNMPSGTIPTGTLNAPYSFVFKHGTQNNSRGAYIAAGSNTTNTANVVRGGSDAPSAYWNYWYFNDFGIGTNEQRVTGNTVTITYNGTVQNGYINNILTATNSNHTGVTVSAGQQYLFRTQAGEYLNGQMYSVYVFGSALNDADRITCTSNPTDLNIKYDGGQLLYNTTNIPITAGSDNYTYVCNYTPRSNGFSVIVEQASNPIVNNTRAAFMISSLNSIYFAGHNNDTNMNYIALNSPRKTIIMCNHNLSTGNVIVNDNGTVYTYTTSSSPSLLTLAASTFCIGRNAIGSEFYVGNINEIIVFKNTLTTKESQLYFTPNAITRKNYRSQPRLQIKDVPKDIGTILQYPVIALDTQMLANMSPGALVTSWSDFTGYNSPVLNATTYNTTSNYIIPPYVSLTNNGISANLTTGQYLDAGTKSFAINTNGGFTAIWYGAFTGAVNAHERIFDFGNGQNSDNLIALRPSTGTTMAFYMQNGGTQYFVVSGSGVIIQNEWAVWTFRYTASTRFMEILKNGVSLVTGTAGAAITDKTLTRTWIGRSQWTADYYSNINTAGLYVYSNFITDANVATISNHLMYCTTPTMPSILPDYNNKIVRYGSILSQGWRNGQAMYFNGNLNSYLDIQDIPNWPLTFCFWFYNTSTAATSPATLCSQDGAGNGSAGWGIQLDIYSNGTSFAPYYSTTGNTYAAMTTSTVSINAWYHIAFTVTPTTLAYYLNGTLVQSLETVVYNTNRLVIGKSGDNVRPFNGYIQDIRVYDYALRADEIGYLSTMTYAYNEERALINYNTPANYLVNMSNWYNIMNINKTGTFTNVSGLSDPNVQYQLTGNVANSSNTVFNSTRIQNYNSFVCSFDVYLGTVTDHGFYFYCGATSSTTVPSGGNTAANSSYYIYFQVTGTKGIYLYNDQGQQLAYSPVSFWTSISAFIPITIIYNRSVRNTWTVNVSSLDVLTYDDPNNTTWVSNIAGDFWGIGGRTTTSAMYVFIRRVELMYTPYINSVISTVNAQNNTKFPPSAMTTNTTTFTGTSILDGVYTATASNSYATGINPYSAFDNNTSTYWGELNTYNTSGAYTGGLTTTVINLITGISTSYSGEWVQLQVPNPVTLNSFSLMGRQDGSLFTWRTPNTFYVAGSNDNSTWQLVHSTSGAQFTSAMQYFTCNANNINKYKYFRIIVNKIGNVDGNGPGGPTIDITAWDLYTQMNTVNANVIAVPPYSMTANTTTFAGNSIYDGTYILTASRPSGHPTMGDIYVISNDSYGTEANVWGPNTQYNNTGAYLGSVSTTVSGVSQSGEWVQMQLPNPIVLYSFSLNFWWPTQSYWAKSFLIAASNDNSTWTNIYDTTTASFVYGTAQTFVVTGSSVAYKYFRLIVRATSGIFQCEWWILDQWKLYTNASNLNLMKFPPAPLTADSPVTFTTVNMTNWYNMFTAGTNSGFTPTISETDPFKQLQLTDSTGGSQSYVINNTQTLMTYNSFTFSFQLYCANTGNGDYLQLYFGSGGYQVTFSFEIYYYNGIKLFTTTGGNVVNSPTNWFNSTWNDIRIVYNRGPTNTWTMFFNETQIIQYSDPNWYTAPGGSWGFNTFNGAARFTSYIRQLEMTIAPVSIPGNSIVSGNYIASASSTYNLGGIPSYAFYDSLNNTSNISMWHSGLNYTTSNGLYAGAITTTVSGTSYSGDWLQLQTPKALQLTSFSIYPRQDLSFFSSRSPRNFVMAGSNDNSTWSLLHTATGVSDWSSAEKYFVCNGGNNFNTYTYFRLITMAICNPGSFSGSSNCLNIQNLSLFTPISLNNSITPATPKGLLDGLTWKYYDGVNSGYLVSYYTTNTYRNIGRCVDTTNLTKITNGHIVENSPTYLFSIEIFGYFRATVSGTYTFSLSSDDGSYLWIGTNALVGYTLSNFNIGTPAPNTAATYSVTLLTGTYYPIRIHYTKNNSRNANLTFSFTPPGGTQTSNGQGFFFSGTGIDSAFPQENAKIIKDITNTNKDGVYYILVNGISTPIHCLMNDCYDGGGWMMLMKGGNKISNTFQYFSNYWTARNTLNAADTTRNNADAKYDTFNYSTVKDVLAIWPDISPTSYTNPYGQNGGSIFVSDGWNWMVNNWNETTRLTPFTGFNTVRIPHQNTTNWLQTYGINNPFRYNGFGSWCSTSFGAYQHVFNSNSNVKVKWGFIFNNETGDLSSCDVFCGIGMGGEANYSAGDWSRHGANWGTLGINRSARFELYGR